MPSGGCEDEDIEESHEGTNVRELDDCDGGRSGKKRGRESACWPWCLVIMGLWGSSVSSGERGEGDYCFGIT